MTKQQKFIEAVAPLAQHEYQTRKLWILPSVCIAQAALESGWNLEAKTLFGIKGKGVTLDTSEYINGEKVDCKDSFAAYPDIASAVSGNYDFLAQHERYRYALCNPDYRDAVYKLIHTADGKPYATDPKYVEKVVKIVDKYDLTKYDCRGEEPDLNEIAMQCIEGIFGDGEEMRKALTESGYDAEAVRKKIDCILSEYKTKTETQIAEEVIAGRWGNGNSRIIRLTKAGYCYNKVQRIVNRMVK